MEPTIPPAAPTRDEVIEQWFADTFFNLALDTDLYNRFHAAKESLQQRLAALVP